MIVKKVFFLLCLSALIAAPSFGQAPQGDAAQGSGGGGAGMPQTKTFNVDDFVADIDADGDGGMTVEEFKAVGLTDRMWTFCDPDGDTKISKAEMAECALPEAVDMNSDGKLTVAEVVTFEGTDLGHERGPGEAVPE